MHSIFSSISPAVRLTMLLVGLATTAGCEASATAEPIATAAQVAYPLKTCVVSGGKLGSMGKPVAYVSRQTGQPDRTVMFCCKACIGKFEKDPARYLAKLDAAGTGKAGGK